MPPTNTTPPFSPELLTTELQPAIDYLRQRHPFYFNLLGEVRLVPDLGVRGMSYNLDVWLLVNPVHLRNLVQVEYQAHSLAHILLMQALGPFWQGYGRPVSLVDETVGRISLALLHTEDARWTPPVLRSSVRREYGALPFEEAFDRVAQELGGSGRPVGGKLLAGEEAVVRRHAYRWMAHLVRAGAVARRAGRPSLTFSSLCALSLTRKSPWLSGLRGLQARLPCPGITPGLPAAAASEKENRLQE